MGQNNQNFAQDDSWEEYLTTSRGKTGKKIFFFVRKEGWGREGAKLAPKLVFFSIFSSLDH